MNKVSYYSEKRNEGQNSRRYSRGRGDVKSRLGPKQRDEEGNSRFNAPSSSRFLKQDTFVRPKFDHKCFECGGRGHLQRNCPEYVNKDVGRRRFSRVNHVEDSNADEDARQEDVIKGDISDDDREMLVGNMSYGKTSFNSKPLHIELLLGSKKVYM